MPTRQIAINEIVELISAAEQRGREEERKEIVEEEQKKTRELVESFLGHRPDRSTP
jgi:Flp pilus assembly CpaF family ATPase